MNSTIPPRILYRQMRETDIPATIALLMRCFPRRSRSYWVRGFERLAARGPIEGCPRFGYLIEAGGSPVGVLLLIFRRLTVGGVASVRCNLSSWCVEAEYSGYSSLLIAAALKQKNVTYINISPADHTLRTIGAQGFSRYSGGQYLALPAVHTPTPSTVVRRFDPSADYGGLLSPEELELLIDHVGYGCIALIVIEPNAVHPFVFVSRKIGVGRFGLPCAQLCFCRDIEAFRLFGGLLGRYLLARGKPFVLFDANGPIKGVLGRYFPGKAPKYFNGPQAPRLGDLAYTEISLFGP